jgi:polar amino acid transport system substrate-binding protein
MAARVRRSRRRASTGKEHLMSGKLRSPAAFAVLLIFLLAGAATAVAARTSVTPPPAIKSAGQIVYCTDISYPPEESFAPGNKPIGSDIDIGTGIAKLMGVKATFKNTTFDSIIPALKTKKCDAIISGMNDTASRRKQVDFVDYLKVGQSLMVKKGNPEHITSLAALSGKRVSVESGTTNRDFLAAASKKLVKAGKKAINIVTFPKDTDAASALKTGRVDAYFGDSPVAVYYANRDHSFEVGGSPINPLAIGIAIRKGDPLKPAVQKAISQLYANGTMKKIVAKWGMTDAVTLLK